MACPSLSSALPDSLASPHPGNPRNVTPLPPSFSPRRSFPTLGGGEEKWAAAAAGEWWRERGERGPGGRRMEGRVTGQSKGSQISLLQDPHTRRGGVEQNPKNAAWGLEKGGRNQPGTLVWMGVVSLWVVLREGPPLPLQSLASLRVASGEHPWELRFYPAAPEERLTL